MKDDIRLFDSGLGSTSLTNPTFVYPLVTEDDTCGWRDASQQMFEQEFEVQAERDGPACLHQVLDRCV